jgi:hypothetical protein
MRFFGFAAELPPLDGAEKIHVAQMDELDAVGFALRCSDAPSLRLNRVESIYSVYQSC